MIIALLSDIHSNLEALDSVLEALPQVDQVVVLGDIVGYGPDPNAVIDRLRNLNVVGVRGNHDQAMLQPTLLTWFNPHAAAAARWTRGALTEANLAFLKGLPTHAYLKGLPTHRRVGRHLCVHGSPRRPYLWEYILDELQALELIAELGPRLCFFGHTHLPRIFMADVGERIPRSSDWIDILPFGLVNPGSVGQPRDGNPEAAYALVDIERPAVAFHRVQYDVAATQAKIRQAGLPEIEAERLAFGR